MKLSKPHLLFLVIVITQTVHANILENITLSNLTNQSVIITWDTYNSSNSTVNYNTTTSLGILVHNTSYVAQGHRVGLTGLTPNTLYYYNISSCNQSVCIENGTFNFTTVQTQISCGNIYINTTLTENLTSNGTCFTIMNDSIALDCNGYSITGNGSGIGINVTGWDFITLRNCSIHNYSYGLYSDTSTNLSFGNITLKNNTLYSLYLSNSNLTLLTNLLLNGSQDAYLYQSNIGTLDQLEVSIWTEGDMDFTVNLSAITFLDEIFFEITNLHIFDSTIVATPFISGQTQAMIVNSVLNPMCRANSTSFINNMTGSGSFYGDSENVIVNSSMEAAWFMDNSKSIVSNTVMWGNNSEDNLYIEGYGLNITNLGYYVKSKINIHSLSNQFELNITDTNISYVNILLNQPEGVSGTNSYIYHSNISELEVWDTEIVEIIDVRIDNVAWFKGNSVNTIRDSSMVATSFSDNSSNSIFNSDIDDLYISVENVDLPINNLKNTSNAPINVSISSLNSAYFINLSNIIISRVNIEGDYSTISIFNSEINSLSIYMSNVTIGNATNISNFAFSHAPIINFSSASSITSSITDNYPSNSFIYGFVDMPTNFTYGGSNITRFYPTSIVNQSVLPALGQTISVYDGSTLMWSGTTNSTGQLMINLTFNSTNYNHIFNITYNSTVIGTIGLLTDTPLNESLDTTPPNITGYTPTDTVSDSKTIFTLTVNEYAICRYSFQNVSFAAMRAFDKDGLRPWVEIKNLDRGLNTVYVVCRDKSFNYAPKYTATFTVDYWYRGGKGYSVSVQQPKPSTSHFWAELIPNQLNTMKVQDMALTAIIFSVSKPAEEVELTIESLTFKPAAIPALQNAYLYFEISKKNLADSSISSVRLQFKVNRTWLSDNHLNAADIRLYRYTKGWVELPTKLITTEAQFLHYESESPAFSTFAIAPKRTSVKDQPQTPQTNQTEEIIVQRIPPQTSQAKTSLLQTLLYLLGALIGVVILGVVLIANHRRTQFSKGAIYSYIDEQKKQAELPVFEKSKTLYPELEQYIIRCSAAGMPLQQIREKLLFVGWDQALIEEYLSKYA
ncbi:MAG: PGF-pre-PGF domain-containing protein [Candidatus Woesearchaeota archaeon]